jgi:hypothetical protein
MNWQTYRPGVPAQFRALEGIAQRKQGAEVGGWAQVHTQFGFGWRAGYSRMKAPNPRLVNSRFISSTPSRQKTFIQALATHHVRNYDRRWWWWHKQQCIPHDGESGICHAVDTPVYWLCTLFYYSRSVDNQRWSRGREVVDASHVLLVLVASLTTLQIIFLGLFHIRAAPVRHPNLGSSSLLLVDTAFVEKA